MDLKSLMITEKQKIATPQAEALFKELELTVEGQTEKFNDLLCQLFLQMDTSQAPKENILKAHEVFKRLLGNIKFDKMEKSKNLAKISPKFAPPKNTPPKAHIKKDSLKVTKKQFPLVNGRDRMVNILHLNVISANELPNLKKNASPQSEEFKTLENCNKEKINLLTNCIEPEKATAISTQASKFPIMREAVSTLRDSLERWNDLSLDNDLHALDILKTQVQVQMKNLAGLSDILSSLSQEEGNVEALSRFTLSNCELPEDLDFAQADVTFRVGMQNCFSGIRELSLELKYTPLSRILQYNLDSIKKDLTEERKSPTDLAKQRRQAPITLNAIHQQAHLHEAIREAKGWTMQQDKLEKLGASANDVYRLGFKEDAIAYFKVGEGNEKAAGTMEKLMWDMAVIMGAEKAFVATGETEIRSKTLLQGGGQKVSQWDEKGNLQEFTQAQRPFQGGIQAAQKGKTFSDLNDEEKKLLSRDEIFNGILTSFLFGMFDAHSGNVFVTEEGKIKFFDNARSMPNSNEFIDRGNSLMVPYRCCLLEFPEVNSKLTQAEILKLKDHISDYQVKMRALKKYLCSKETQAQLSKLPHGWMNVESSFAAMEERLNRMEKAFATAQSVEDLVSESSPSYKFAYALTLLDLHYSGLQPTNMHAYMGYIQIENVNRKSKARGINLNLVKKWSQECTLSELQKKTTEYYKASGKIALSTVEKEQINQENDQIEQQILSTAVDDYKDFSRQECAGFIEKKNLNTLKLNEIEFLPQEKVQSIDKGLSYAKKEGLDAVIIGGKDKWEIIRLTPTGHDVKRSIFPINWA